MAEDFPIQFLSRGITRAGENKHPAYIHPFLHTSISKKRKKRGGAFVKSEEGGRTMKRIRGENEENKHLVKKVKGYCDEEREEGRVLSLSLSRVLLRRVRRARENEEREQERETEAEI